MDLFQHYLLTSINKVAIYTIICLFHNSFMCFFYLAFARYSQLFCPLNYW